MYIPYLNNIIPDYVGADSAICRIGHHTVVNPRTGQIEPSPYVLVTVKNGEVTDVFTVFNTWILPVNRDRIIK